MKLVARPGVLALIGMLVAILVVPQATLAEPATAQVDLDEGPLVMVPLAIARQTWLSEPAVTISLASPASSVPSDGRVHRVSIGGRRIAIWCMGTGSPTVILEHGIGYGVESDLVEGRAGRRREGDARLPV